MEDQANDINNQQDLNNNSNNNNSNNQNNNIQENINNSNISDIELNYAIANSVPTDNRGIRVIPEEFLQTVSLIGPGRELKGDKDKCMLKGSIYTD